MSTDRDSEIHKQIFLGVDRYLHSSRLMELLQSWGHKACARLRKFDTPGSTVLDLGCGPGYHFRFIKKANFIGLDNMPEMAVKARETLKFSGLSGRVIEGDIFSMPFPDEYVDSIVSSGVFEHLLPLDEALEETRRVLRPGGEFILLQPCEGPLYRLGRKLTVGRYIKKKFGVDYQAYLDAEHTYECGPLLREVGKFFRFDRTVGIPFRVPVTSINAFVAVRYTK